MTVGATSVGVAKLVSEPTRSGSTSEMSSREIAELTGKEHKNVLADIRKMLNELGKTSAEFSANLPDAYGRLQQVFNLPKDLTITLVSGYNVQMRHRIVTRWQELEFKVSQPAIPQSLPEALRLAADVAAVLGYSDAEAMTRRLDDDEKSNLQIVGLASPTGGRGNLVINESGLYSLILTGRKPEAKRFTR